MRFIYLVVGLFSAALGIIGAFLPVIPTTPLLLLALFCFSKSSERFHTWLIQSSFYEKYLEDFVKHRSMPLKRKIFLVGFASTMLLFPLIILSGVMKLVIVAVYVYLYYYFIFEIKTA